MPSESLHVRSDGETVNQLRREDDRPGTQGTGRMGLSLALRACILSLLLVGIDTTAWASTPPRIDDKGIRIGLRDGPSVARSRNGVWTVVTVPVQAFAEDVPPDTYRIEVQTTDGEAVPYRSAIAVPAIPANSTHTVFVYVRPGSTSATFGLALQKTDGSLVQTVPDISRDSSKKEI